MSRAPRHESHGAWHHVMNRGGCRREVFRDPNDRKLFLSLLAEAVDRTGVEVHAYCLMNNHYHLLVRTPNPVLGVAVQHLAGRYTQVFNRRHGRDGALFRGRYHSVPVKSDGHLVTALRYIHRNPTNDFGIHPDKYEWSSHRIYTGNEMAPPWLATDVLLSLAGGTSGYKALVFSALGDELVSDIVPRDWHDAAAQESVASRRGPHPGMQQHHQTSIVTGSSPGTESSTHMSAISPKASPPQP